MKAAAGLSLHMKRIVQLRSHVRNSTEPTVLSSIPAARAEDGLTAHLLPSPQSPCKPIARSAVRLPQPVQQQGQGPHCRCGRGQHCHRPQELLHRPSLLCCFDLLYVNFLIRKAIRLQCICPKLSSAAECSSIVYHAAEI